MASDRIAAGGRIRSFFGLSRMTHSVLDIAHPAVGAIIVIGGFPRPATIVIGLLAAFAGFTAVFALNDVMDCGVDCEKMAKYRKRGECFDIDSVGLRHPIAQGTLAFRSALAWVIAWGASALVLAYLLNPVCAGLMVVAAGLEMGYCRLLRVTHWKALLSGLMVSVGGLAGVFAVTALPAPRMVILFVLWAFAWEVGCRNIPNDWSDLEEDIHLGVRTIPVRYGRRASTWISFALLSVTVAASLLFPFVVAMNHPFLYLAGAAAAGGVLLIAPAVLWLKRQTTESAMFFFNRACFYPLAVFAVTALLIVV